MTMTRKRESYMRAYINTRFMDAARYKWILNLTCGLRRRL